MSRSEVAVQGIRSLVVGLVAATALAGCERPAAPTSKQGTESRPVTITAEVLGQHNLAVALMGQFNYERAHDVLARLAEAQEHLANVEECYRNLRERMHRLPSDSM